MILWCISWMRSYAVLHGIFSVRCSSRGRVRRRCCRHKEGDEDEASLMKFLIIPPPLAQGVASECHLGQRSLWSHIYEIHLSPSFLSLFLFFLLHAGSFSPSALIGGAVKVYGVSASSRWGLVCVSHWRSPFRSIYYRMWSCLLLQLPNFCFAHKSHSPKSTVCTSNNLKLQASSVLAFFQ